MTPNNDFRTFDGLDRFLDETLAKDAARLRARFAQVPDDRLTAALALKIGSRGIGAALIKRLALYGGAAAFIAGTIYFFPTSNVTSTKPIRSNLTPAAVSTPAPMQRVQRVQASPISSAPSTVAALKPAPTQTMLPPHSKPLRLKDDTGTIPTYTDPNYKGPVNE